MSTGSSKGCGEQLHSWGAGTPGPEDTPAWTQEPARPTAPGIQPTLHRRGEGVWENRILEPGISPNTT